MNKSFIFLCVASLLISGLSRNVSAVQTSAFHLTQDSSVLASQRLLDVAFPESATVNLACGGSYSGLLTYFSALAVTLSASGMSQIVPLAEISHISFYGNVWIPSPEGTRRRGRIRGLAQTIAGVPQSALVIESPYDVGTIDLFSALSNEEYERLSSNPNQIHAVKEIIFENSDEITIKVVSVRR